MIDRTLRRPSPAMAVALAALVVALTGSAVAGVATVALDKADKKAVKKIVKKTSYTKAEADARFLKGAEADARYVEGADVRSSQTSATNVVGGFNPGTFADVLTHNVDAPTAGRLLVWGNLTVEDQNTGFDNYVKTRLIVDGSQAGVEQEGFVENSANFYSDASAPVASVPVQAGPHVVKLQAYNDSTGVGGTNIVIENRSITTLFIPS